jgi:hypothetical protein
MDDKSTKTISGSNTTGCLLFSAIVQGSAATDAYVMVSIATTLSAQKYSPATLCFNGVVYRGDSPCSSEVFLVTIADAPEGTAPLGAPFCPGNAAIFPLSRLQSLSVRSQEADSAQRPFIVTATALTLSVCPSNVRIVRPVSRSQKRKVPSPEPETTW